MTNKNIKKDQKQKRVVLAYGETTGHAHAFYGEDTVILQRNQLTINKTDALKHEEHNEHVFEPGIGEVTIQREYELGELRKVID